MRQTQGEALPLQPEGSAFRHTPKELGERDV
jgi:hypothetical protein